MGNYIGVYGLGVMGSSLALNISGHGYTTSVFNIEPDVTRRFMETRAEGRPIDAFEDLAEFVASLERPRKVLMMVKAGDVVDSVSESLAPLLEPGDILIDCGNSFYKDTIRRERAYGEQDIYFFGVGVSGGEKGALVGPSIMPGGDKEVYEAALGTLMADIAAHAPDGTPCCGYIGPDGAGHYVKMVHNGIEYGDIQIICEAYFMMRELLGMGNAEMADVFEAWNQGRLSSYLIDITAKILRVKDPETGDDLVDHILDEAGQKGTGMWTACEGLEMGAPIPTLTEAVFARNLSAIKQERLRAAAAFGGRPEPPAVDREAFLAELEQAVYASKITSYAQGFALLALASDKHGWDLSLGDIALLWREGCIIRAKFLDRIKAAFDGDAPVENLILSDEFKGEVEQALPSWRHVVAACIKAGLYIPVMANSLMYLDGYTSPKLPANLLQAQRDWFGAHTYRRDDRPHDESFHTVWESC